VGSPAWLLGCWLLAGALTIIGALCYSELAAMYPQAGGQYVFLRQGYGRLAGFLYGWTLFAVIQSGTIAAVGVAFAKFLGVFVPWVSNANVLMQVGMWKFSALQMVAVVLIAFLTGVNCLGIQAAKFIQNTFTVTKVSALLALIAVGLFASDKFYGLDPNLADFWQPHNLAGDPIGGLQFIAVLGLAMVGALFACDAWNNITFAGEEVSNAEKVLPKSLALGTSLVILIYLLANIVYLLLLPLHGSPDGTTLVQRGIQFAAEDRVGTAAAEVLFGPAGRGLMAAAIMVSTFGCLNGLILAGPRAYYAMARDGLFFRRAGVLNPVTNVPTFGLIIQGVWAAALATTGTYSNLLEYIVFAALLFYVLTVAVVFILRKKEPDTPRPYRVVLYPIMPAMYILFAVIIMIGQIFMSPLYSGAGLLLILSGLPAYMFWSRRNKT
jgi:APA family basic amino acid/polyamine antiporter